MLYCTVLLVLGTTDQVDPLAVEVALAVVGVTVAAADALESWGGGGGGDVAVGAVQGVEAGGGREQDQRQQKRRRHLLLLAQGGFSRHQRRSHFQRGKGDRPTDCAHIQSDHNC